MKKNEQILDSWKEIAVFLQRGVRSAQRWEKTEGLPVRRHQHIKRGSVYAVPAELTEWLGTRRRGVKRVLVNPNLNEFARLRALTEHQVALAGELKQLLTDTANMRSQLKGVAS